MNREQTDAIVLALASVSPKAAQQLGDVTNALQGVLVTPDTMPEILATLVVTLPEPALVRFRDTLNCLVGAADAATPRH